MKKGVGIALAQLQRQIAAVGMVTACGLFQPFQAHAVDVLPGAYTALPEGTNIGQLFFTHIERDEQYVNGLKRPINARLDSDVVQLRLHHFMNIGGYLVDPNVLVPSGWQEGKNDSASLGKAHGLADIIVNAAVWLVNDSSTKTYFGITPYLFLPTGEYDKSHALNMGENRWKFALQGGYSTGLTDKVRFDLTGDVTTYGTNTEFGAASATMKQADSYQVQTYLRYFISPAFEVNAGLSSVSGGETEVNGVKQANALRTSKFMIGAAYFLKPKIQLMGLYGHDNSVDNGFKESNKLLFRLTQVF